MANHGHFHDVQKYTFDQIGDQEFLELNYVEAERIQDSCVLGGVWTQKKDSELGWGISQEAGCGVNYFDWVVFTNK